MCASASGHRDGNPVVRRTGKSDQARGRRRDPRRLRSQNPTAQSSRPEGAGAVRRRLHLRDRLAAWRAGAPDPIRWVVISVHGISDWAGEGEVRTTGVPFRVTDGETQIVAVRQGLGMTTLPCFVGDADPLLVRVPGTDLHLHGTLWLLTQGDRKSTRLNSSH